MAKALETAEFRRLAEMGATARLIELERERNAILREFPRLRSSKDSSRAGESDSVKPPAQMRRRRRMSAAARKAVSLRMKRYWASRRKEA